MAIEYVVGGRVRVPDNDGTQLGIYNGAMGTIHSFGCKDPTMTYHSLNPTDDSIVDLSIFQRNGVIIFVQMDKMALTNKLVNQHGERIPYSCSDTVERLVPFAMKASNVVINLPAIGKYRQFQYPLLPAQACTIHKSQGMTAHKGLVLHMKDIKFEMGLAYVGLSRATNLFDIYLITLLHCSLFTSHA